VEWGGKGREGDGMDEGRIYEGGSVVVRLGQESGVWLS
jgi:hypothetical protein